MPILSMNVLEFISSLVWPGVAVVVFFMLRPVLVAAVLGTPKPIDSGSLDFEWDRMLSTLRRQLHVPAPSSEAGTDAPAADHAFAVRSVEPLHLAELVPLAHIDPGAAVVETFNRLEQTLRAMLEAETGASSPGLNGLVLGYTAHRHGLIDNDMLSILERLATIRNMAAHGYVPDMGRHRALEYIALADSTLDEMRRRPRPRPVVTSHRPRAGRQRATA